MVLRSNLGLVDILWDWKVQFSTIEHDVRRAAYVAFASVRMQMFRIFLKVQGTSKWTARTLGGCWGKLARRIFGARHAAGRAQDGSDTEKSGDGFAESIVLQSNLGRVDALWDSSVQFSTCEHGVRSAAHVAFLLLCGAERITLRALCNCLVGCVGLPCASLV